MKLKATILFLFISIYLSFSQVDSIKIDENIRCIFQDSKGNYWFGTNDSGVYYYDGKTVIHYTSKDGLPNNQIQNIQEDEFGNLWFSTGLFGVCKLDGKTFTAITDVEISNPNITPKSLWFYGGGGCFYYDNKLFYLPIGKTVTDLKNSKISTNNLTRFSVYSVLKDSKGNVWFGTQAEGVCCYDGKTFTWFTDKGLAGPAVLALFEDKKGNIWMGNNGAGLFCYNGKTLTNFTKEKKLDNPNFQLTGETKPNTLARIYAINEDLNGTLWIGTVDNGVWLYDGKNCSNYTTKDGLTSNAINTIYKDKNGEMWLGTDQNGICKFDGTSFSKFITN